MSAPFHPWLAWVKDNSDALARWKNSFFAAGLIVLGLGALVWQGYAESLATKSAVTRPTDTPAEGTLPAQQLAPGQPGSAVESSKLGRHTNELYKSLSVFESPAMLEKKRVQTLERDLADAIRQMPIVEDADVKINATVVRDLQTSRKVSAIVLLKTKPDQPMADPWLTSIRAMVAGVDVDLRMENVQIVDLTTGQTYSNTTSARATLVPSDSLDRIRRQEEYWDQKIRRVLASLQEDFDLMVSVRPLPETLPGIEPRPDPIPGMGHEMISVCVFLKRDAADMPNESRRQAQYSQLRQTLQNMDPRLHVDIYAIPRPSAMSAEWSVWVDAFRRWSPASVVASGVVVLGLLILFRSGGGKSEQPATPPPALRVVRERETPVRQEEPLESADEDQELVARVGSLVRDDPDSAARIIQHWMRKAG